MPKLACLRVGGERDESAAAASRIMKISQFGAVDGDDILAAINKWVKCIDVRARAWKSPYYAAGGKGSFTAP